MILTGWRIAAPEFANTTDEMLSGRGAFLYGGRWNSPGNHCVYLGTSLAQASMEIFVHLRRNDVLKKYHRLAVSFEDCLMEHINIQDLPDGWNEPSMTPNSQAVGDDWIQSASSLILQVPSAAILGEYNYLLNPQHSDMDKLQLGAIEPFSFDPRMRK